MKYRVFEFLIIVFQSAILVICCLLMYRENQNQTCDPHHTGCGEYRKDNASCKGRQGDTVR